jgi:molybdopterin biosynthesis enzyme
VITTGKEVLPLSSFLPGVKPLPGQVIDCTTPYLSSLLLSRGFEPIFFSPSGDSPSSFASSVSSALSPCDSSSGHPLDLLITTAGVSLGTTDHIPSTLTSLAGISQVFHGVALRPGAPVMLSLYTDSASGRTTPILSLPGNPMASAVGMRSFGCELLSVLEGAEEKESGWEAMKLPPAGAGREEARAWEELAGRVKGGSTSFFALPLDEAKQRPTMLDAKGLRIRTSPCALSSLVNGEVWVRIEALEDGGKSAKWCRF